MLVCNSYEVSLHPLVFSTIGELGIRYLREKLLLKHPLETPANALLPRSPITVPPILPIKLLSFPWNGRQVVGAPLDPVVTPTLVLGPRPRQLSVVRLLPNDILV